MNTTDTLNTARKLYLAEARLHGHVATITAEGYIACLLNVRQLRWMGACLVFQATALGNVCAHILGVVLKVESSSFVLGCVVPFLCGIALNRAGSTIHKTRQTRDQWKAHIDQFLRRRGFEVQREGDTQYLAYRESV